MNRQQPRPVLCVRPDGSIEALHDESLELDQLGPMDVRRASSVEYESELGQWVAVDLDTGKEIFRHRLRSRCLEEEVRYFNERLARGLAPFEAFDER